MLRKTMKAKLAPVRRPPLQLLMTSVSDDASALSAGTNSALSLIFELFPHLGSLTVQTTGGDIRVTRDFTSGNAAEVDRMLAGIFGNDQAVTGIAFPATSTKPEHTATPDNPYWPRTAKHLPPDAALAAGEIPPHEAIVRAKTVNTRS